MEKQVVPIVTVHYRVLVICQGEKHQAPQVCSTLSNAVEYAKDALTSGHISNGKGTGCRAAIVEVTTNGTSQEFTHVATFYFQKLLGEKIVYEG